MWLLILPLLVPTTVGEQDGILFWRRMLPWVAGEAAVGGEQGGDLVRRRMQHWLFGCREKNSWKFLGGVSMIMIMSQEYPCTQPGPIWEPWHQEPWNYALEGGDQPSWWSFTFHKLLFLPSFLLFWISWMFDWCMLCWYYTNWPEHVLITKQMQFKLSLFALVCANYIKGCIKISCIQSLQWKRFFVF